MGRRTRQSDVVLRIRQGVGAPDVRSAAKAKEALTLKAHAHSNMGDLILEVTLLFWKKWWHIRSYSSQTHSRLTNRLCWEKVYSKPSLRKAKYVMETTQMEIVVMTTSSHWHFEQNVSQHVTQGKDVQYRMKTRRRTRKTKTTKTTSTAATAAMITTTAAAAAWMNPRGNNQQHAYESSSFTTKWSGDQTAASKKGCRIHTAPRAAQIVEELKRRYPGVYSLPTESSVRTRIASLVQEAKKSSTGLVAAEGSNIVKKRGR